MEPGPDRLAALGALLSAKGLQYSILGTGPQKGQRHVLVPLGSGRPRLAIAAHYDRFPGSPGFLDNSAACLQLVDFAQRHKLLGGPPLLILFTDAEESAGQGSGPCGQGAFSLAARLRGPGARGPGLPVLVLDVTGRGDRLILSSAPGSLLARHGLSDSSAAAGHRELVELARRSAARALLPRPRSLGLPWSDDLGLVLGGLPALTVSLLPAAELAGLGAGLKPRTWELLHSDHDSPELAEPSAFGLMGRFLDAVAAEYS